MARRVVLGVAVLALVTAGCAVKVNGTAAPAGNAPPSHGFSESDRLDAEDALGDLAEWNPCSVVDPDDLPESWNTEMDSPAGFEDCVMNVTTDDGKGAEVQVGYLYESDHDVAKFSDGKRSGGLTIVPVENEDGSCTRDIVFDDGIALAVLSWPDNPDDAEKVCDISDTVADAVAQAVFEGRAERLQLPENSIGDTDPCELVSSDITTKVPGITADVRPSDQVHRHSCWWHGDNGNLLNVEFEIGGMPSGDSGETRQDRYTAVTRYPDDAENSLCVIDGEHVPFKFENASGLMERVGIWVYLQPGQVEEACTTGLAVADVLWPKLPSL
jgi:hypothetical protein